MKNIILFIRDTIVGVPYVIITVIAIFFIFVIIGYLGSLKYNLNSKIDKL